VCVSLTVCFSLCGCLSLSVCVCVSDAVCSILYGVCVYSVGVSICVCISVGVCQYCSFPSSPETVMHTLAFLMLLCKSLKLINYSPFFFLSVPVVQFNSVAQSCPTLCNPIDCSMPGFHVHHQLPESVMPSNHLILCHLLKASSCLQSFPTSGSFPMSQFFTSGLQSMGVSASVLPKNIQD